MSGSTDSEMQVAMGARLRAIREVLNLTQSALGEIMGVGGTTIASWESGRNQIDIIKLARAAKHAGFTTDYIALADMAGLRFDIALKLQSLQRQGIDADSKRPRGRPSMSYQRQSQSAGTIPTLRDLDPPQTHAQQTLNEVQDPFIPKP
jgi:transcriptional regulator with XRE-family HTH domain